MRVREENCGMLLLAAVTLVSVAIAGGASLLEPALPAGKKPVYLADRTMLRAAPAPSTDPKPVYLANQTPARVVGTPFVPNVNPRER
jgi:hypothetical protein